MSRFNTRPRRRALWGTAVLAAALLTNWPGTPHAHAALVACYTDPVVYLSNGVTVNLSAAIYDTSSDVRQITYTLHAPVGTSVTQVVHTGSVLGGEEKFNFYADTVANAYNSDTKVETYTSGISVTATTQATSPNGASKTASASGRNDQHLLVYVSL